MKSHPKTYLVAILIGTLFTLNACDTNLDNIMSAEDFVALQAMESSYIAAVESNSSLANYIGSSGITNDQTCFNFDKAFHKNDSIFEDNHMRYSHKNQGDNHTSENWSMGNGWMSGNGGMMGNNGSMMGNGFNSNFCDSKNLDLMDSLMIAHDDYHPGN